MNRPNNNFALVRKYTDTGDFNKPRQNQKYVEFNELENM